MVKAKNALLTSKDVNLTRTTLIREVYRALINTGRSYAAFTKKERELVESLKQKKEILDPMSGYGLLTRYCAERGLRSYCVEFNLPQYLWQILSHPANAQNYINCITLLISWRSRWPKSSVRGEVSDNWFPDLSQEILGRLLDLSCNAVKKCFPTIENHKLVALALLLPFVGRLSCSVPGDISTHTKMGGMCVYHGWEDDYLIYLHAVKQRLEKIIEASVETDHVIVHGDARTFAFPKRRFGGMITSPPYPNHRDFISMFTPEHIYLGLVGIHGSAVSRYTSDHIIGSNFVSDRLKRYPKTKTARRFLSEVTNLKKDKTGTYDDEKYYIPYFEHYFADLEEAYENVSASLKNTFEGYIVVVNNTHRNLIIPVSDTILEIWKALGFKATIYESTELFHIGTKNPRARGLRAKHMEYVIKIWR
jgi:hypothetical protein